MRVWRWWPRWIGCWVFPRHWMVPWDRSSPAAADTPRRRDLIDPTAPSNAEENPTPDPPRPPPPHPHDRSPADQPARSAPDGTHDGDTHPETTQQQITSNRCPSGVANGSLRQLHFPTSEGILTFTTPSQRAPKPRIWV